MFCSNLFAIETVNKTVDFQNEIYASVGLPSFYTLGESFLDYASSKMPGTDYDMFFPKGPGIEIGYSYYFNPIFAAGFECHYEMGKYSVYNQTLFSRLRSNYPTVSELIDSGFKRANNEAEYRHALDDFRLAIELLLKIILKNDKSLENQKEYLLSFMEEKGLSVETRNMFFKIF